MRGENWHLLVNQFPLTGLIYTVDALSMTQPARLLRGGGGNFLVNRVGMTVGKPKKYPKKYQAMHFADPKRYHLE